MTHVHPLVMLLLAVTAFPAGAELSLTAEAAAKMAGEKNPEIMAARFLIAQSQARTRTTGRLANPELSTEIAGGQDFEGRVSIGLTQRFPLTARLRIERELSAIDVQVARLEVQNRQRQIAVSARTACYELTAARQAIALVREHAALADAFAKSIGDGVSQGFGSLLDGQQALLAADMLRSREASLRAQEITAAARLNSLLGRPADAAVTVNESLVLPREIPARRPTGIRPDLQLAEMSVRAGASDISLAKANRWDDVGVGVFVEGERFRDEPDGIEPEALVGVQFNVPLPFWQNGAGRVAEKEASLMHKTQQLDALRFAAESEVITAYQVMTSRHRAAAQMEDRLVPAARQQVTDAEGAYGRAELDITRIFAARERLAEIESAALDARKNFFLSYSEWLGTLGEPPVKP